MRTKQVVKIGSLLFFIMVLFSCTNDNNKLMKNTIYSYSVETIAGNKVSLEDYKGKVVLVVNTASECGFTPQFEGLEMLYEKHKDEGLVILGFPCNQFGGQEPGAEKEINSFCQLNYGVTFPMFSKVEVNGKQEDPLFTFLKEEQGSFLGKKIKWNFTKFLINKKGEVVDRFSPTTKPKDLEKYILKLM